MAIDDADRAALIAAYRAAERPPADRSNRVLARLLQPGDYAVLLPDEPAARRWPLLLLVVAAAVIAVLALELTGEITARIGRVGRFEAADAASRVRQAHVAGKVERDQTAGARSSNAAGAAIPPPPPAELPPVVPIMQPTPVVAAITADGVPIQRPRALVDGRAPAPPTVAPSEPPEAAPVELTPEEREAALVNEARRALNRRAWVDASNALDLHEAEFPNGTRSFDRSALRIIIACRIDPGEPARAAARRFIVEHAKSFYTPPIIGACRTSASVAEPFE